MTVAVAGVDFGTDSVRVSVWDLVAGACVLTVSSRYRRWAAGEYCDADVSEFRQHPLDHIEAIEDCFDQLASALGDNCVVALAVDSTGSTPAPTDAKGVPLALLADHSDDPDCMFWLWKDHTASQEAALITEAFSSGDVDYTQFQGQYSSEWWWAKILRGAQTNAAINKYAVSWVEHSDWIANLLVGRDEVATFTRNSCAAGHKAYYNRDLGGLVPDRILAGLHPHLAQVARTFRTPPAVAGSALGTLTAEWAARLHLSTDTIVGVGSLDAHAGAVGAGIARGTLVKVVGTSTVDMFVTDRSEIAHQDVRSSCGVAEDSIVPGLLGGEAGQAAFGDLLAWYARLLSWPMDGIRDGLLESLEQAARQRGASGVVALDWINGRRYPHLDDAATAALLNLRIGHDAVDIYRSLVTAAVLGSRAIYERLTRFVDIERVILVGGVARKSPLVCQSMANALDIEVMVCSDDEVCAKGAAIFAAVAVGHFDSVPKAQEFLCAPYSPDFHPQPHGVAEFDLAYDRYVRAGEFARQFEE